MDIFNLFFVNCLNISQCIRRGKKNENQPFALFSHKLVTKYKSASQKCCFALETRGGGVLSGKVGTGMCGPDRVLFRPLRFSNCPLFYLKISLNIGRIFAKCIIFVEFFLLVYL